HRIALRSLLIIGRGVDEALQGRLANLGNQVHFTQLTMRHVLQSIEVLVVGGNFNSAAPAARAVEDLGPGVRDRDAIHVELVIVEAFVLSVRNAGPYAFLSLGHGISDAADVEQYALGVRRPEDRAHAPLRVDLRILFAR